jgi:hypothetical protein
VSPLTWAGHARNGNAGSGFLAAYPLTGIIRRRAESCGVD